MFSLTETQANAIRDQYDALAKTELFPTINAVYACFDESADEDFAEYGYTTIELTRFETKNGQTQTITIEANEVTID